MDLKVFLFFCFEWKTVNSVEKKWIDVVTHEAGHCLALFAEHNFKDYCSVDGICMMACLLS